MNMNKTYAAVVFIAALGGNTHNAVADIKADAETIFNWTEKTFPAVLPSHQPTQATSNWLYREYLSTDIYTGININDNGVYYIYGKDLAAGKAPVFYKPTSALLSEIGGNKSTACDASKIPAGHQIVETGNTVKISTNGCIAEPLETPEYCPQNTGTISFLTRMNTSVTIGTTTPTPNTIVFCTMNAAPNAIGKTVELDVCYNDDAQPPRSTRTQGKLEFEQVADCLKTEATYVIDSASERFWIRTDEGDFLELNALK